MSMCSMSWLLSAEVSEPKTVEKTPQFFDVAIKYLCNNEEEEEEDFKNYFIPQEITFSFLKKKIGTFKCKSKIKPITQSENHLNDNLQAVEDGFCKKLAKNKQARRMFKLLHKKEKEEQKKGRYTFVHAQKWEWHFLANTFKKLWEIKYGQKINDYQFLRFVSKEHDEKKEKKKRLNAKNGTEYNRSWLSHKQNLEPAERLFMNYAIFGNAGNPGCCSAWYWFKDHDQSYTQISTEDLFTKMSMESHYKKYAQKLETLENLHKESSTYGNLLLLSFTPKQMSECVIPADVGGNRLSVTMSYWRTTYNTKKILDELKKDSNVINNSNDVMFCTILTHDCALDPINGPRIYSFNAPDNKKFKEYEKLRDEIFEELTQEIKR